jgi:drug/metabolite transporter (DMT)-like permease
MAPAPSIEDRSPTGPTVAAPNARVVGLAWACASALGSAAFVIPWKLAARHGEAKDMVLVLLTSAAILNSMFLPMRRSHSRRWSATAWAVAITLGFLGLLGNEASAASIRRISGPLLSVLQRIEVPIVGALAWLLLAERPTVGFWLGALVASFGVALIHGTGLGPAHAAGVGFALLGASCFAGMAVVTRRFIDDIEPVGVNALRLWFSVLCWLALYREVPIERMSFDLVLYASLAAFFGPFLGRLFLMFALRHIEARIAALCILLAPVATLGLSWALLGDIPTAIETVGGAMVLAGIAIPFFEPARRRASP